jgi:hypothetical protein
VSLESVNGLGTILLKANTAKPLSKKTAIRQRVGLTDSSRTAGDTTAPCSLLLCR